MLAMKLMAMRLDPTDDKSDLAARLNLHKGIELSTPEAVVDFVASFYPEARITGRLRLGIQALWRVKDTPVQEGLAHPVADTLCWPDGAPGPG